MDASAFDTAREGLRATGASVGTRELVELLARHGEEEGKVLAEYADLVASADGAAVRYLGALILDDERRHHAFLTEIANSLAWDTRPVDGAPSAPPLPLHLDADLLAATRRLRGVEDADRKQLQALRRRLRDYADTTVWALLVDVMLLDTEKHATILRFLERHADAR
jgi:ATP-dependent DNA ligase